MLSEVESNPIIGAGCKYHSPICNISSEWHQYSNPDPTSDLTYHSITTPRKGHTSPPLGNLSKNCPLDSLSFLFQKNELVFRIPPSSCDSRSARSREGGHVVDELGRQSPDVSTGVTLHRRRRRKDEEVVGNAKKANDVNNVDVVGVAVVQKSRNQVDGKNSNVQVQSSPEA